MRLVLLVVLPWQLLVVLILVVLTLVVLTLVVAVVATASTGVQVRSLLPRRP
jgi:hypothetical protein